MPPFTDRVVLVTGATSGIGRAIALRLARDGAAVVVNGRREEAVHATVEAITVRGGLAVEAAGDVTREADAHALVMTAVGAFGRLDSLVNNAGAAWREAPGQGTPAEQWQRMLDLNLTSGWRLTRRAVEEMRRCGEGWVLNVASNLGLAAVRGMAAYSAAKGAVVSLTRALALDLAADRIRVNCLCPGLVRTAGTEAEPGFAERAREYAARCPLGRVGAPEDVAGAAAFLLSADAAWITGQALVIDGGTTIQG